jgi:hypothetical protein
MKRPVGMVIIAMILSFINAIDGSPVLGSTTAPLMSEYAEKELNSLEERISFVKSCESNPKSKWIDGKCFYFLQEIKTYEDAQYECSDWFKTFDGNVQGRIYEPRNRANFELIFKTATDIFGSQNPVFWLGIDDIQTNGEFRYRSDDKLATNSWTPWYENDLEGEDENCLVGIKNKWDDRNCSSYMWVICESISEP